MTEGLNGEFHQGTLGLIKSRERLDDFLNKIDELSERWDNRLSLERLSVAERYRRGDLGLLVSYVFQGQLTNYCIAYHSAVTSEGHGLVGMRMRHSAESRRGHDQHMLVDN